MFRLKHLKLAFIVTGSCIGAGFITGAELVRFFGSSNFIPAVYIACAFIFLFSYLLMDIGRRYGSLRETNRRIFKKHAKVVETVTYICVSVIAAGMLAGIDSLLNAAFMLPSPLFLFSVLSLVLAGLVAAKGVGGIARMSIIFVPVMLCFILYFLLKRKNFSYSYTETYSAFNTFVMSAFYASMNMFLAAPVLIDAGSRYKYGLKTSAAMAALCLFVCIILILSAVSFEGSNALMSDMPLLYIAETGGALAKVFIVIVYIAMFTSLASSYYPLHSAIGSTKYAGIKRVAVGVLLFLLSRIGMGGIIKYFYPLLGALGILYLSVLAFYMLGERGLVLPLYHKFFDKRHAEIHNGGKRA